MSTRGTVLLAIGMLVLGLVLGAALGGVAGYFAGQNASAAYRVQPTIPWQSPAPPTAPPTSRTPVMPNLPRALNVLGGARIEEVEKDSPAEKAGLQVGDVITAVGSTKLSVSTSLADVIKTYKPGDKVELAITRGRQTLTVTVELGAAADNSARLGVRYVPLIPGGRFRFPDS